MVYDTSTDTSSLKVDRMHVLFDFAEPGTVQVVELFIISNPTDNVIVAPNPGDPVITYELPEGASNITFQEGTMGDRYVKTEKGFGDLQAISPGIGQHQILFAYNLPYEKTLDLSIPVPLPVDAGIVMVPEGGVSVTSNELTDAGTRAAETVTLHVYTTSNLTAGSTLDFTLKGRPGAASTGFLDISDHNGLIIGLAALGLLLVGLGVWVYLSRVRSKPAFAGAEVFSGPASKDDADGLMDAIIALDDQFRSGGIAEDAYRQRRAELKQRLAIALGDESKAG
jgi:hypothetical protein